MMMKRAFMDVSMELLESRLGLKEGIHIVHAEHVPVIGIGCIRLHLRGDGLPDATSVQEGSVAYALSEHSTLFKERSSQ